MTAQSSTNISHTPGPYFYERGSDGCDDTWRIMSQPTQSEVATLTFWDDDDADKVATVEANARLLAAAPDMLDALKEIVAAFDRLNVTVTNGPVFQAIRFARHAIALADGTLSYRAC